MTAVYIILAVVGIIAAFLLSSVKVYFFGSGLQNNIVVKFLFFKINPSKGKKKKDNDNKESSSDNSKKKQGILSGAKEIVNTVSDNIEIIKKTIERVFWLLRHIRIKRFTADICVSDEDAAQTAIYYGLICTAVYPFIGFLQSRLHHFEPDIKINCDYNGENHLNYDLYFKTKIIFFISAAFSLFKEYLKSRTKKGE